MTVDTDAVVILLLQRSSGFQQIVTSDVIPTVCFPRVAPGMDDALVPFCEDRLVRLGAAPAAEECLKLLHDSATIRSRPCSWKRRATAPPGRARGSGAGARMQGAPLTALPYSRRSWAWMHRAWRSGTNPAGDLLDTSVRVVQCAELAAQRSNSMERPTNRRSMADYTRHHSSIAPQNQNLQRSDSKRRGPKAIVTPLRYDSLAGNTH